MPEAAAAASESVVWMVTPALGVKGTILIAAALSLMNFLSFTAVAGREGGRNGSERKERETVLWMGRGFMGWEAHIQTLSFLCILKTIQAVYR